MQRTGLRMVIDLINHGSPWFIFLFLNDSVYDNLIYVCKGNISISHSTIYVYFSLI